MDSDELGQIHESAVDDWLRRLGKYNTDGIEKLASKYRDGDKCMCVQMNNGSFNWCFKVSFDDGTDWAVRLPVAGNVMHREEKVRREVAVMRFLKEKTLRDDCIFDLEIRREVLKVITKSCALGRPFWYTYL